MGVTQLLSIVGNSHFSELMMVANHNVIKGKKGQLKLNKISRNKTAGDVLKNCGIKVHLHIICHPSATSRLIHPYKSSVGIKSIIRTQ